MYIKLCYNQEYEREVFEVKLLFKQRLFSWFDSYDIYDEKEQTVYVVKGQLAWGHCLKIFNVYGEEVGTVKEKVLLASEV